METEELQKLTDLIIENQNLIYSITHYFPHYPNKEDLFQVGCKGFIKAYYNYNPSFQTKFTTYAYPYILGEMKKYVREDCSLKVSRELDFLNLKIDKVSVLLSQRLMREPTLEELALELHLPVATIVEARKAQVQVTSMDAVVACEGKELTLQEVVSKEEMDLTTLVALREELLKLQADEQQLIEGRYFLGYTQSEIAAMMGMTQVQVSRKEQKVLVKLRDKLVS